MTTSCSASLVRHSPLGDKPWGDDGAGDDDEEEVQEEMEIRSEMISDH